MTPDPPDLARLRTLAAHGNDLAQRAAAAHHRMVNAPLGSRQRRHHQHSFERLARKALTTEGASTMTVDQYFLSDGSHTNPQDGRCAMEWVAYLAGEQHSDQPVCVSPVLKTFCIRLNDRLGDDDRQKLRPYLARTIGTAGDGMDDQRVQMCREWLVRFALPRHLDAAGRSEAAARLRGLPDALTREQTLEALYFASSEAYTARDEAVSRLSDRIRAELAKRGYAAAAAVADADALAASAAAAAADAASAAAAAADALAVADAAAAAASASAAVAVADAAAGIAPGSARYWAIRRTVREALREKAIAHVRTVNAEMLPATLDLLNRMLPTEAIQLPVVVADAAAVCAVPVVA